MKAKIFKQLIKFPFLAIIIISVSCQDSNQKSEKERLASLSVNKLDLEKATQTTIQDFIACKEKATERTHCRSEITKVISDIYGLSEFKNTKLDYVIYDSIQPIIKRSKQWKSIGVATSQKTLNEALEHTNKGGLSLIIDTSNSYGHVVMILPGETQVSGSWALRLPKVLSLLNSNASKSFMDKSLSFAFKKSPSIQVYTRE